MSSIRSLTDSAALTRRLLVLFASLALAACGDGLIQNDAQIPTEEDAGPPDSGGGGFDDGGGIGRTGLELIRVVPDNGPFTGGTSAILRGNGFTEDAQVTFGGRNVQPADHRLIDPRRLAVVVPAGEVGPVDVSITVGDETVTLEDGYTYNSIYAQPSSGSVSGGTVVAIIGSGTNFQEGDRVIFGRTECQDVRVVSATRMECRTPPSSAGTVDVIVERGEDASQLTAPDGFTYYDSSDPFAGGLGGGPIEGAINLTVIDALTGAPVPDAFAVLGEDLATEHQGLTDALGQITFSGEDVAPPATIHVAKHCYEKTSFHTFDARDVTVFLIPWQDPICGMGSGGGGGRGRNGSFIEGELIWYGPNEMGPNPWLNVPEPRPGWTRVAYVYTTRVLRDIPNPPPDQPAAMTVHRVLETPTGVLGYPYSIFARPAGLAVYAIAGLEENATQRFVPYVMGVGRNVLAGPGEIVTGVDIVMNIPLDHYLDVELRDLPREAASGPDRFVLRGDIDLGGEGVIVRSIDRFGYDGAGQWAVISSQELDVVRRRDLSRAFRLVAQPSLDGALSDGRYRAEASWVTTEFDFPPMTTVVERGITAVDDTVVMGNFLGLPAATAPANGESLPEDRIIRWEADGAEPSFHVVLLVGADNNPAWRGFTPGNVRELPIPDLSTIPGIDDIPSGFLFWQIYAITVPGFDWDAFRYSDLNDTFWQAWATDYFTAQR